MLSGDDLETMRAGLLSVRDDNLVSVVIRRGATALAAQEVRIARTSAGHRLLSQGAQESRGSVVVLGDTDLDIQVDDRLTVGGVVFRVAFVRPNRTAATMAECEAVE